MQLQNAVVDLLLDVDPVPLDLQVVVVAEDLHELARRFFGFGQPLALDQMGDLSTDTAGEADQPLGVLAQQFLVDAGVVVIPFEIALGDQFSQISVADVVFSQQHQVVGGVRQPPGGLAQVPAFYGDVDLGTNDRFYADLLASPVVLNGTKETAVIGDCQGGHSLFGRPFGHLFDVASPIEQAVFAVTVEMDKISARRHLSTHF